MPPNRIKISREFSEPQKAFISCKARFKLWRASRRQGKTNAAEYEHCKFALTRPNTINWYVAQDLALCKELNIPLFREFVPDALIKAESKADKSYTLFNNSYFYFKTANSSDSLRGRKIHKLTCEEPTYWQNGKDIFHNILRPQLADTLGGCSIIFTPPTQKAPRGAEWVRRLEQQWAEQVKAGNPDYAIFHNTIWDSPFITEDEKKEIERSTDPETWQCEYMAEYNDKQGTVYWEFDPLSKKCILPPNENVIMRVRGMDFGIEDYTACVWALLLNDNRVHIELEYVANNLDVPTHADKIKQMTQHPQAWTILDSACWSRDASLTSVAKRFAEQGIGATQATRDLDGSISDLKRMFAAGKITIDPKCVRLLEGIDGWQFGQHEPDVCAAMRYAIDGLIRAGKLLPPLRNIKQDIQTTLNYWQTIGKKQEEMLARENGRSKGVSFRFYK